MKQPSQMTATELAVALGASLTYQDGWPFQAKVIADQSARSAACRLIKSLQGDPEIRKILEKLPE